MSNRYITVCLLGRRQTFDNLTDTSTTSWIVYFTMKIMCITSANDFDNIINVLVMCIITLPLSDGNYLYLLSKKTFVAIC